MNWKNEVGRSHLSAAHALVCFILVLVLVAGDAHAATLSLTETVGGPTLVGQLDAVSSFSFSIGLGNGQFVSALDALSPILFQYVTNGTLVFEADLTADFGTLAFQNVHFTAFSLGAIGANANETVSFTFGTMTTIPAPVPLPGALSLFATGLGALGLLGWRRKKDAAALAAW